MNSEPCYHIFVPRRNTQGLLEIMSVGSLCLCGLLGPSYVCLQQESHVFGTFTSTVARMQGARISGPKDQEKHKDPANHGFCNSPCPGPENQNVGSSSLAFGAPVHCTLQLGYCHGMDQAVLDSIDDVIELNVGGLDVQSTDCFWKRVGPGSLVHRSGLDRYRYHGPIFII